jgi:hypothetical protein
VVGWTTVSREEPAERKRVISDDDDDDDDDDNNSNYSVCFVPILFTNDRKSIVLFGLSVHNLNISFNGHPLSF